ASRITGLLPGQAAGSQRLIAFSEKCGRILTHFFIQPSPHGARRMNAYLLAHDGSEQRAIAAFGNARSRKADAFDLAREDWFNFSERSERRAQLLCRYTHGFLFFLSPWDRGRGKGECSSY